MRHENTPPLRSYGAKLQPSVCRQAMMITSRGQAVSAGPMPESQRTGNFLTIFWADNSSTRLDDLGVAGLAGADLLVGRLAHVALAVAGGCPDHTRHPLEGQLRAPEAAGAEHGRAQPVRLRST